jgi:hypothetical protein
MTRPIGSKCTDDCRRPTQSQAHCSVCHRTFGGVRNFDLHRHDGWCLDPAGVGLVDRDGVWRRPPPEDWSFRPDGTAVDDTALVGGTSGNPTG